jgi:succinate dehydrogenase/fumarate reductase flavoprotein subunit
LDIFVFGRRAGAGAAKYSKKAKTENPNLEHVIRWQKEIEKAGIAKSRPISPRLLPDYARQPYDYLADYAKDMIAPGQVKVA